MIVDAHHHFWNPARVPQAWMRDAHAAINRPFEPADLLPLLDESGIGATVLVQSGANDADTDYMFEVSEGFDRVRAITAWLPLDDRARAEARLAVLMTRPTFRAVRHLIHQEADPHWILRPEVEPGLALLEEAGVPLELPAEFPDHLGDVPELALRHPGLQLVVDHLAKPPLEPGPFAVWQAELEAAAARPNVVAKVSGLSTSADLVPAVRAAHDAFGPSRLLFGSDWPVSLLGAPYRDVVGRTIDAIRLVAGDDADAILGTNAARVYRIE